MQSFLNKSNRFEAVDPGITSDYTEPQTEPKKRPQVAGKFIVCRGQKFYIKGVTYGAFKPDEANREYHDIEQIERDFALMAAHGFNTVRIPHTMPPRSLLDIAERYGLMVMVGLSAEQYVGFLIDRHKKAPAINHIIREKVMTVAGHPALLCYALGNEIPAAVVRWIGRQRIERYLRRIYRAIKAVDPEGLVTYVNYPTTEFLQLPFLDFVSFNVYLESPESLRDYLARLQNIAGNRPLLMSEVGLDAMRNGESKQATVLEWQIQVSLAAGCVGIIIFSWTDEWFRGGSEVDDWAFGLTDRERTPKAALDIVQRTLSSVPFPEKMSTPRFSVVVCSYNGSHTLRQCLEGLRRLTYPNFEVTIIDDGSTDTTTLIAAQFPEFRLIRTTNHGLSHARNIGMHEASGDYIAYIDDDAWPDSHWLHYLAQAFQESSHAGIGGPNIAPLDSGFTETCVDSAPGGPTHVLLKDQLAEHIPGCNMAFRKEALEAVGGFDATYHVAGDDVDLCWRIQQQGWTIGYHGAAMIWHRRRNSIRTYLKQQHGYGKAETLLEQKWPEKYNYYGHVSWGGRVYGNGILNPLGRRYRVYHGEWGSAPFQSLHESPPPSLLYYCAMPEWWLVISGLLAISLLSYLWHPLLLFLPLALIAIALLLAQAFSNIRSVRFSGACRRPTHQYLSLLAITYSLHILQPVARLLGRRRGAGASNRRKLPAGRAIPLPRQDAFFTETWIDPLQRLYRMEAYLADSKQSYSHGGNFDTWDFQLLGGSYAGARFRIAVEDQGSGTQYVRLRTWPVFFPITSIPLGLILIAAGAFTCDAWSAASILGLIGSLGLYRALGEAASAQVALLKAMKVSQVDYPADLKQLAAREKEVNPVAPSRP